MGILRRLFGSADRQAAGDPPPAPVDQAALNDEERAHELELARFEQERTDDLVRRQQRYAARSWTPPAQGGEQRAEDNDASD